MKKVLLAITLFLSYSILQAQVKHAGAMSEMGKTGFAPRISLDSLQKYKGLIALGPLGKMQGEITAVDGVPYTGIVTADENSSVQKEWQVDAPFLVYAHVEEWEEIGLRGRVGSIQELEQLIESTLTANGVDLLEPLPFRIQGAFDQMVTHIVTPRSADVPGYVEGKTQSNFDHEQASGELIGFYSKEGKRIYTHHDSFMHVHFLSADKKFAGHLDQFESMLDGAKLLVPKARIQLSFAVIDTEFSKGRLGFEQRVGLDDLVKFHGHLCDGLVLGAKALDHSFQVLFDQDKIDRTDIRIISAPSPCLTDVATYLSGGRIQFGTQSVQPLADGLFVIQRISDGKTIKIGMKPGIKPLEIIEMTAKAENAALSPCELDELKQLEDEFSREILYTQASEIFDFEELEDFQWSEIPQAVFPKTDVINKNQGICSAS
ncbi:acetolactate decarboxylase [Algoriphagus hitonicola]|uniref:Alpha-acetolactate decarboxylase n=1 Tax=Algoriphagus hitonicola TaxID=435880 RepID=A0A1I2VWU8_9BACT|nr:acetolactate decarboxylase [Algoriphagus hitonicola]SFG93532.1 acetolactate decarboxylase [Algoriphagus hitonicola]